MSNSYRKPFHKGKLKFFQNYHNRRERRITKHFLNTEQYEKAEARHTRRGHYDVIDYIISPYGASPLYRTNLTIELSRK